MAAARLMYDYGIAGTSVGDVQKAAGVGPSQVYHYFADKQSLVRAVIAHRLHALLTTLDGLDSMEGLRAWRDVVVDAQRQRNRDGGCLVGELAEPYPQCRADLAGGFDEWEAAIRTGLQAMCDRGNLSRTTNPERLATALLAAVEGGTVLAQIRRDTAPLETALDEVLDRIEDLRPPGARRPVGEAPTVPHSRIARRDESLGATDELTTWRRSSIANEAPTKGVEVKAVSVGRIAKTIWVSAHQPRHASVKLDHTPIRGIYRVTVSAAKEDTRRNGGRGGKDQDPPMAVESQDRLVMAGRTNNRPPQSSDCKTRCVTSSPRTRALVMPISSAAPSTTSYPSSCSVVGL